MRSAHQLEGLEIREISLVDRPANPHAKVIIAKRLEEPRKAAFDKAMRFSAYLTRLRDERGMTPTQIAEETGIDEITIAGILSGKSEDNVLTGFAGLLGVDADQLKRLVEGEPMSKRDDETGSDDLAARVAQLEAELKAKQTEAEAAKADLAKRDEGASQIEKAMADLEKRFGEERTAREKVEKAMAVEVQKRRDIEFAKRAVDEFPHLPGDPMAVGKVLQAIEAIADEDVRKTALETLKAQHGATGLLGELGTSQRNEGFHKRGEPDFDTEFAKAITKAMADDPKLDRAQAAQLAMQSNPDLQRLYSQQVSGSH